MPINPELFDDIDETEWADLGFPEEDLEELEWD
jgi:hypothetical protein